MSSGKCKLKQQWDTTTHLSEWPKSGTLDNIKCWWACGALGTLNSLTVERQNSTATLEDSLAVSYKINHILIIWSNNHTH